MAIVAGVLVVGGLAIARAGESGLRFAEGTPADLRPVAARAWERFTDAVPSCEGRLGTVTVGVAWELPDRARYEPGPALVLVRAPGTAANLEASLIHEFAHHAECRCGVSPAVRRRFTAAGGSAAGTPWRAGPTWDRTPSERFAEAVVRLVLGHPPAHVLIHLRPEEIDTVARWARHG
jgi:hypothetical protein